MVSGITKILRGGVVASFLLFVAVAAIAHPYRHPHVHRGTIVLIRTTVAPPRPLAHPVFIAGQQMGAIDLQIEPEETTVTVDGIYHGTSVELSGATGTLFLPPGVHRVTLKNPEGESWSERVTVLAGEEVVVKVELVS